MTSNLCSISRDFKKFGRVPFIGTIITVLLCCSPIHLANAQTGTGQLPVNPGESLPTLPTRTDRVTNNDRAIQQQLGNETLNRGIRSEDPDRTRYEKALVEELPNDFQNFILLTTGQLLPVYGNDLFRNVPATFAPLDRVPVPSD